MIYLVGFSPFPLQDSDGVDISPPAIDPQAGGPAGRTVTFLGVLMQQVAQLSGQPAAKQLAPAPATPRVTEPPLGRSGSEKCAAGNVAMKEALRFVLEHEGSRYVASDAGKESSKYGILQATAARCGYNGDVRYMSRTEAEAIYRKIWDESGCGNLPAGLAVVHFDTYMNSPKAAEKMLRSSGGSTDTYLRLRARRYARLSELRPARFGQYMKGWMKRIHDLRAVAAQAGPSSTRASI